VYDSVTGPNRVPPLHPRLLNSRLSSWSVGACVMACVQQQASGARPGASTMWRLGPALLLNLGVGGGHRRALGRLDDADQRQQWQDIGLDGGGAYLRTISLDDAA